MKEHIYLMILKISPIHNLFLLIYIAVFSLFVSSSLAQDKPVTVRLHKVKIESIIKEYSYPVSLSAMQDSRLYSVIDGYVAKIFVSIGTKVNKGQSLMLLQNVELGYNHIYIKSKISGQVSKIDAKLGSQVKSGDLLIHLIEPNKLGLLIEIPESELTVLAIGDTAEVKFDSTANNFPVKIIGISPHIKNETGTATAELIWDKNKLTTQMQQDIVGKLYSGMLGQAVFKKKPFDVLAIPVESISNVRGKFIVRKVKDNISYECPIKLGKELSSGMQEILSGINVNDEIIVSSDSYVKDKQQIKVE